MPNKFCKDKKVINFLIISSNCEISFIQRDCNSYFKRHAPIITIWSFKQIILIWSAWKCYWSASNINMKQFHYVKKKPKRDCNTKKMYICTSFCLWLLKGLSSIFPLIVWLKWCWNPHQGSNKYKYFSPVSNSSLYWVSVHR